MELHEALSELLGGTTGGTTNDTDLANAAREAWRRRHVNSDAGAAVLTALVERGYTYGQISDLTGIPRTTAYRWGRPPGAAEQEQPAPEPATAPEPPAVVAAIVVSEHGALVGQRVDGKPPWTFIAGEIEPRESPTDAIEREVKEETGLMVKAADRPIGRRVHPKTGRTMIYLACQPTHGTDVFVGDTDELAAVRWVPSLRELDELLPGMFEPVHDYLAGQLD